MASKIKNTVDVEVRERGSAKTAKGIESVGRAQTRMGQSAASTGRQFSAQASGLGGLVAAYAGAAANIFALQQAFAALQRAAQAETIVRGTKTLALEIGASGQEILNSVKQITQGQLTLEEAAQNTNIALSAGFGSEQISRLTEVSMKASRALGRSLTDAMMRVTRGAAKMEPELLDELGIFTRIDPAVEKYAASLNVAASSLTNYERRQAFVNAVIEEGEKKFSSINVTAPSAQKSIERLTTTLTELGIQFGQLTANVLTPFLDFISNNANVALLAFAGVLKLVFGKAAQMIGAFSKKTIGNLDAFAKTIAKTASISKESIGQMQASAAQAMSTGGGLKGVRGKIGASQDPAQLARFQGAKAALQSGAIANPVAMKEASNALKEHAKNFNKNTVSAKALNAEAAKLDKMMQKFNFTTKTAIGFSTLLNGSVRLLAAGFKILGGAMNIAFAGFAAITLIDTIFDTELLNSIKGMFVDLSQTSKDFTQGLVGGLAAAGGGAKKLEDQLKSLGATDALIENLEKVTRKLFDDTLTISKMDKFMAAAEFILTGSNIGGNQNVVRMKKAANTVDEKRLLLLRAARIEESLGAKADFAKIKIFELLADSITKIGTTYTAVGAISRNLGLSSEKVALMFEKQGTLARNGTLTFERLGISVNDTDKKFRKLPKATQATLTQFVLVNNTLNDASEAFDRGSANAETLSKKLVGVRQELAKLQKSTMVDAQGFITTVDTSEEEKAAKLLAERVKTLKQLEAQGKALRDVFGSSMKALDEAVSKGLVGINGIAKDANQIAENQANFLRVQAGFARQLKTESGEIVKIESKRTLAVKEALELQRKINDGTAGTATLNSEQVQLLSNRTAALKAIGGEVFKIAQDTEKATKATEKQNLALQNQIDLLQKTRDIQKERERLTAMSTAQKTANSLTKAGFDIEKAKIDVFKEQTTALKNQLDFRQKMIDIQREGIDLDREVVSLQGSFAAQQRLNQRKAGIGREEAKMTEMDRFPGLFTHEEVRAQQEKLINMNFVLEMEVIAEKRRLAKEDYANQLLVLDRKRQDIQREQDNAIKMLERETTMFNQEQKLREAEQKQKRLERGQEIARLAQQKKIVEAEKQQQLTKIGADEKMREFAVAQQRANLEALKARQLVVDHFVEAVGGETAFVKSIEALMGYQIDFGGTMKTQRADFGALEAAIKTGEGLGKDVAAEQRAGVEGVATAKLTDLNARIEGIQKLRELDAERARIENDMAQMRFNNTFDELNNVTKLTDEKLANIEREKAAIAARHDIVLQKLSEEEAAAIKTRDVALQAVDDQYNYTKQFSSDVSRIFSGELSNSLNSFFNDVAQGKGVLDSAKDAFNSFMQTIISSLQKKVTEKFITPALDSFFAGIFTSGGSVRHMAGGGMMRDRVPAMLEPGEFVIRKPMAKAIGGPALHAMNGTGKGLAPNIEVVVNNEGTPKDAQASVKPQIDVDKLVVEIVTRDIRNNGPIRKTLRTGAN